MSLLLIIEILVAVAVLGILAMKAATTNWRDEGFGTYLGYMRNAIGGG